MKFVFILTFLLFSVDASAQQDVVLPDAASFIMARAAAGGTPSVTGLDVPTDPAALVDNQKDFRPRYDEPARWDVGASTAWLARGEDDPPTENAQAGQGLHLDLGALLGRMNRPGDGYKFAVGADGTLKPVREGYHWKGLLWESFAFFGVENTQRLLADPYLRILIADKPFWHDYMASVKQWNWGRWNDGDNFLVAYIGHPLQGSITEFIEIQNSPRNRDYRINDGKAYWKSRLQSFYWATAFSFDQKLGPLGETAIGNEGAYNYVNGCSYYCSAYFADPSKYKVTNNTGWVKLVTTPVVGTLWTVVEDAVDHFISDRVQGDRIHRVFPKILRGSLNPSRTAANILRWRVPWYRDWQHDATDIYLPRAPQFLPGNDEVILAAPRYEFFPHLDRITLPVNTMSCSQCKQKVTGYGFGLSRRIATYADLDADVNLLANASPLPSDRAGGSIVTATFGLRSGYTAKNFALKAYLRPGFLSYDRAYEASPSEVNPLPPIGRITHFTAAIGLDGDVYVNRHLGFRGVFGNQPVRYRQAYRDPPGVGTYPYLSWLSKLNFLTNENWTWEAGPVLRF